jgi:hypothetical protein
LRIRENSSSDLFGDYTLADHADPRVDEDSRARGDYVLRKLPLRQPDYGMHPGDESGYDFEFIQGLHGNVSVTFEEVSSPTWLHDLLKPHVSRVVVCDPRKNALLGSKRDRIMRAS